MIHALTGTWRLVEFADLDNDGKWQYRLGEHPLEGSLAPEFTDTDQPRPFRLEGDRLEIGDGKTWRRVLERVLEKVR